MSVPLVGPGDVSPYLALIASQHRQQPKYLAATTVILQGMADARAIAKALPSLFDLDNAVGDQLDTCGKWIGKTRTLNEPIANVYFSWDTPDVGWDQGVWHTPGDPTSTVVSLPDTQYRTLLKVWAAGNLWDGTTPGAYAVWDPVFVPMGFHLEINDHADMTMEMYMVGTKPDALTMALYTGGYFDLKPPGVQITAHHTPP